MILPVCPFYFQQKSLNDDYEKDQKKRNKLCAVLSVATSDKHISTYSNWQIKEIGKANEGNQIAKNCNKIYINSSYI